MTEKLNSRYNSNLNEEQKQIVQKYSLYCTENHHGDMRKYLSQLKESTINVTLERITKYKVLYKSFKISRSTKLSGYNIVQ